MDIVIPLRSGAVNEELRYTLRSICENVPHDRVWLSGYMPPWVKEAGFNYVYPAIGGKYGKAAQNILAACQNPKVSENFLLFNDDFFIMQPMTGFKNMHRGPMTTQMATLPRKSYYRAMRLTYDILRHEGFKDPLNYGLHIPMIINKKKWLETWRLQLRFNRAREPIHLRSLYGNLNRVGGEQMDDPKIADLHQMPTGEERFLSSNDDSFEKGLVGQYVRDRFNTPCKYE